MEDVPRELIGNSYFQDFIKSMAKKCVIEVNNQLKFKEIDVDDELVKSTILLVFNEDFGFEFLKTINLAINGADETAFGNVNDFLNKIEALYLEGKSSRDEIKTFGGI